MSRRQHGPLICRSVFPQCSPAKSFPILPFSLSHESVAVIHLLHFLKPLHCRAVFRSNLFVLVLLVCIENLLY